VKKGGGAKVAEVSYPGINSYFTQGKKSINAEKGEHVRYIQSLQKKERLESSKGGKCHLGVTHLKPR